MGEHLGTGNRHTCECSAEQSLIGAFEGPKNVYLIAQEAFRAIVPFYEQENLPEPLVFPTKFVSISRIGKS